MNILKSGVFLSGTLALCLGLVGCADESPWGNTSTEKGVIDVSLVADFDINTEKPVFHSDDDGTRAASGLLSDYISLPSPDDFSIRLDKADGSYSKTWSSIADFKSEAVNGFSIGSYTLTAFYGEKGAQDFEKPYFEASSSFMVLSEQTCVVDLTAELKNSMVKINYTDRFKDYMQDFHSSLRTEGRSDEIVFAPTQTKPAFIEPKNASLSVHFTTKDKGFTSSVNLGDFAPLAKTLHNITLDVGENQYGDATLLVIFDSSLQDENFEIDLTEELLTTPIPVINCSGFMDSVAVDMLEGNASADSLKMSIYAQAGIQNAVLTVESTAAYKPAWGYEIDLCTASELQQQQLATAGITATGLFPQANPDQMAFVDFSDYGQKLPTGVHTLSLTVTDKNGAISKTSKLILNSLPIEVNLVGDPAIVYGSGEAFLTFDYNGLNPMSELTFTAENDFGNDDECRIVSCEEASGSRAFDTKRYIFRIELPVSTKSSINISAYHNNKRIGTYNVPVIVPQYSIAKIDAFSQYAYLQVATPGSTDPSVLAAVVNNIQFDSSDLAITSRNVSTGVLAVTGLTPGSTYSYQSSITGGDSWQSEPAISTESEPQLSNGNFSSQNGSIASKGGDRGLKVGGGYLVGAITYTPASSFSHPLPADWASINAKTAWENASNYNSWYVVPSSWLEDGKGLMRNVGYNNNGNDLEVTGEFWSTTYYCTHTPGDLNSAAGEFFLGSYSFNGSESRNEGISFASRPKSISFDYDYTPINGDHGFAEAVVLDAQGAVLASKEIAIASGTGTASLTLEYEMFAGKPSTLRLKFKSSNQSVPPINIPSGSALNEGTILSTNGNNTIDANNYKAVATGSVLTIDNVSLNYGSGASASGAPKRNSSKK